MKIVCIKKERNVVDHSILILFMGKYCRHYYQCKQAINSKCKYSQRKCRALFGKRVFIENDAEDFSGTDKCPAHAPKLLTCWDCKYCDGDVDGVCNNPNRKNEGTYDDWYWGKWHRCTGFELDE